MRAAALPVSAALLAGLAAAARAQEPDPAPRDTAVVQDTAAPPQLPAARPYIVPRVAFSLTIGTLGFADLQTQPVLVERLDATGAVEDAATLERTLGAEDGLQVGGSALVGLTPAWAIRAGATWGGATLSTGYAGEDAFASDAAAVPQDGSRSVSVLAAEAALRFRMRSARRAQPYVELGAGVVRLDAEESAFPGAESLSPGVSPAAVAALGAVVPLWRRVAARVQATGQLFRTPAVAAPAGGAVGGVDTLRVTFAGPAAAPFADPGRELTRILRLDFGVSVELGAVARPRAEPGARPSGSRP